MLKNQKEKELKQQLKEENPDWGAWDEKEQIQITMLEIEMKKSSTIFQEVELMTRWLVGLNLIRIA